MLPSASPSARQCSQSLALSDGYGAVERSTLSGRKTARCRLHRLLWNDRSGEPQQNSNSTLIISIALVLFPNRGAFVVAASTAVEGKRHQSAPDHQSEDGADAQQRKAPVGQFNAAGMSRPTLIDEVCGRSEQQA